MTQHFSFRMLCESAPYQFRMRFPQKMLAPLAQRWVTVSTCSHLRCPSAALQTVTLLQLRTTASLTTSGSDVSRDMPGKRAGFAYGALAITELQYAALSCSSARSAGYTGTNSTRRASLRKHVCFADACEDPGRLSLFFSREARNGGSKTSFLCEMWPANIFLFAHLRKFAHLPSIACLRCCIPVPPGLLPRHSCGRLVCS